MVDLPIPQEQVVEAQTPTNRVSGMQYARSGNYLADGLQKLAGGLEDVAVPLADQAARNDVAGGLVTRNADGSIQYNSPASLPIFGAAGEAYNHAVQVGGMAQGQTQVTQDLNAIRLKFQGDPAGLATAMGSYNDNLKTKMGGTPLGDAMVQEAQKQAGQYQVGAADEKSRLDLASSRTAIDANIADLTAQGTALASTPGGISNADGTPTQAFVDIQNKLSGYYKNLVANPLFGYPQDKADIDQQHLKSTFMAENLVGTIDQTYSKHDKATAQALLDKGVLENPDLPDAEKNRLYSQGMARLQFLDGDTKAAIAGNDKAVTEIENGLHSGVLQPDNPAIGFAIEQSKAIRDTAGVMRLNDAVIGARGAVPLQTQTDQQRRATLGVPPAGAPGGGGNVAEFQKYNQHLNNGDVQSALRLSEGLRTNAYWDVNHWRTGYGSDTVTRADGSIENVTATTQITPEDAERDLQRRTGIAAKSAQDTIGPAWSTMTPGAQAALTSVVYNYGHVPSDIAAAASGGNSAALSAAISSHANDNGGVNFQRRQAEAGAVMGQFGPSGPQGAPPVPAPGSLAASGGKTYTAADLAAHPYLNSYYIRSIASDPTSRYETAKNLGEGLVRSYSSAITPDPTLAAQFVQMSQEPAMKDKLSDLGDKVKAAYMANATLAMPNQADRDAHVGAIMSAVNGGQDIHTMNMAAYYKDFVDKGDARMKAAPLSESAQRGIVPQQPWPIEGNPPGALGEIVTQRAKLADRVTAFNGTPTPLLEKRDEPEIGAMLQGPGGDKALASLQGIDQGTVTKLLSQPAVGEAVAGMAKSGDPVKMAAAYSFIGQQYRNNPMDVEKQFGKDTVNQYMAYTKALSFLPQDAALKRVLGWSDPAQAQAREDTRKLADEELKGTTGDQVAAKFSTFSMVNPFTWLGETAVPPTTGQAATSSDGLRASFADAYRDQRELGVDKGTAEKSALTLLQSKWGLSGVNGNQVMRNPPEYHYPAIDGSRDWIGEQLDKDMYGITGADKARPEATARFGEPTSAAQRQALLRSGGFSNPDNADTQAAINLYTAPRSLASDSTTEADLAAGKPPSYYVAVKGPSGLWSPMQNKDHTFVRFRPDPSAVPSVAASHAPGFTTGAPALQFNQM